MTASAGPSSALLGLLRKETYHILRDRRTLIVITLIPILQVIIFGYAIRTDVQHVRLAIVDPAPDYVTLALRGRFGATDTFRIVAVVHSPAEVDRLFQRGDAQEARDGEREHDGHEPQQGPIVMPQLVARPTGWCASGYRACADPRDSAAVRQWDDRVRKHKG